MVGDVPHIELLSLAVIQVGAAGDLPRAGEPGLDEQTGGVDGVVAVALVGQLWPRPDETHGAGQDIEQLGQLVERSAADETADLRHTRVVPRLEGVLPILAHPAGERLLHLVRADPHRAELVHGEGFAVLADALLCVEHRAAVLGLDGDGHAEHWNRAHHKGDDREDKIAHALDGVAEPVELRDGAGQHRHGVGRVVQVEGKACIDIAGGGDGQAQLHAGGLHGQGEGGEGARAALHAVGEEHHLRAEAPGGGGQVRVVGEHRQPQGAGKDATTRGFPRIPGYGLSRIHRRGLSGIPRRPGGTDSAVRALLDRGDGDGLIAESGIGVDILQCLGYPPQVPTRVTG